MKTPMQIAEAVREAAAWRLDKIADRYAHRDADIIRNLDLSAIAVEDKDELSQQQAVQPTGDWNAAISDDDILGAAKVSERMESFVSVGPVQKAAFVDSVRHLLCTLKRPQFEASKTIDEHQIHSAMREIGLGEMAAEDLLRVLRNSQGRQSEVSEQAAPSTAVLQAGVRWDLFPGWLIDHCEGEILTEEMLQRALSEMLAAPSQIQAAEQKAQAEGWTNRQLTDFLPEGVMWGDNVTPELVREILHRAALSSAQSERKGQQ